MGAGVDARATPASPSGGFGVATRTTRSPDCSRARTEAGCHAAGATSTTESDSAAPWGGAGVRGGLHWGRAAHQTPPRTCGQIAAVSVDNSGHRAPSLTPRARDLGYRSRSSRRVHPVANDASRNDCHGAIRAGKQPGLRPTLQAEEAEHPAEGHREGGEDHPEGVVRSPRRGTARSSRRCR